MKIENSFDNFLNKKILLKVDVGANNPYFYRGVLKHINLDSITIIDIKDGEKIIFISRIIEMSEVKDEC